MPKSTAILINTGRGARRLAAAPAGGRLIGFPDGRTLITQPALILVRQGNEGGPGGPLPHPLNAASREVPSLPAISRPSVSLSLSPVLSLESARGSAGSKEVIANMGPPPEIKPRENNLHSHLPLLPKPRAVNSYFGWVPQSLAEGARID